MSKNILIGIGNLLFCDDGFGVFATAYLRKNFTFEPELELLDGGTLGFNLFEYFVNYDNVFIIDTVSIDDKPGELYKIPSEELLGSGRYKNTAHEVEVVEILQACELHGKKADVIIFGVVPDDIRTSRVGLSRVLGSKFELLMELIINSLEESGIKATRVDDFKLQEIIDEY